MNIIKGEDIYNAFNNGAVHINNQEEVLNAINFFPVPDGDTGSNMVTTINSIVDHVTDKSSVKTVVYGMSEGALIGARGNSGFIFAQFINGFYHQTKNKEEITEEEFIMYLNNAFPYVKNAINTPIKGTIVTIIEEWTSFLKNHYSTQKGFKEILKLSLSYSKGVLQDTKLELDVLKKNGVVDAGAKGFYHFIEGIVDYFIYGKILSRKHIFRMKINEEDKYQNKEAKNKYRYCTEFFLTGEDIKKGELREYLDIIGDSGIIAVSNNQAKVHVHTNEPSKLANKIYNSGYRIIESKVDDMLYQVIDNQRKDKIALVTDSVADISNELLEKYHIYVIPMILRIDKSEFLDRITIKSDTFFKEVNKLKKLPKSSMPNLRLVKKLFNQLIECYDSILYISLSSALSGTYNSIKNLASEISNNIYVLDSKKNAGAQGIVVLEAAKLIKEGFELEGVIKKLKKVIEKTEIYVVVDNFEYMVLGGRVPKTIGFIGSLINIRPIVSLDSKGKGIAFGGSISRKKAIDKIYKILKNASRKDNVERVVISYSKDKSDALNLERKIKLNLKISVDYIQEISSAVAISTGENALAISFTRR